MTEINKNIDDILLSIESNNQTIDDMLTAAKENNSRISSTMHNFAASHSCLNREQISAYADYAKAYDNIKCLYNMAISSKKLDSIINIHNTELAYSLLDEVHTEQLSFMERLCSLLEKAGTALKLLCGNR